MSGPTIKSAKIPRVLTPAEVSRIQSAISDGVPMRQIAHRFAIAEKLLYRIRAQMGVRNAS